MAFCYKKIQLEKIAVFVSFERKKLNFPKVFLGFHFWTFINVQKREMEKSLGKTGFKNDLLA